MHGYKSIAFIVLSLLAASACGARVLTSSDLDNPLDHYLTDDLNARPIIPGYARVDYLDNKWSPDGGIEEFCSATWQQCVDKASNTTNAAGFVYQDKALGSQSNCCFIKFDIKPPNKIVNALPGQTSVAYKKLPQSFPTAPGNPGNYGLTLIGVYESFGDDIGGFISFPGMNLGDCLFACSLPTFSNCVGVLYRKEAGINNNVKCYLKSKIAEPVQSWTRGLSGYLYAKPEFSSVLRPDFVNSQPLSDDILISDPIRGKTFLSSRWGSAVPNDQQLASSNLQWTFVMQATGDLVLYNKDSAGTYVAKWWTNPLVAEWSLIPYGFYLLQDGNLVILYGASRQVVWSSNSARGASQGPYILKLFNNGRLAVFNKDLQLTYEIKAW